ncbi:hypothetical protein P3T35_005075 [Kitasatospora sp. GP30]|nr:hypothetical protein [Kitasatospora sp. GP30]
MCSVGLSCVWTLRGRQQSGDPAKAAAALLTALALPEPPLRLVLGADAVAGIRGKLPAVGADLDRTAELSLSTAVTD